MTIEEFHKVLLCIVYGSSEIFNKEIVKKDVNCHTCPYREICDKVISVYFEHIKRQPDSSAPLLNSES